MILLVNEPPPKKKEVLLKFPQVEEVHRMRPYYVLTSKVTEEQFRANEEAEIEKRIWPAVREHKRHLLKLYAFDHLLRIRDAALNEA
jgi:hypothetical protein